VLLLVSEVNSIQNIFHHNMDRAGYQFEKAIAEGNAFELTRLLSIVKEKRIALLEFKGSLAVRVGEFDTAGFLSFEDTYPIVFSGAELGTVKMTLSLTGLSAEVLRRNRWIYLMFLIAFIASVGVQVSTEVADARAREQLARQVAHDIRSPLSFLKILSRKMAARPEGEAMQMVVDRIEGIAEALLAKSRQVSCVPIAKIEKLDLKALVESVLEEKSTSLNGISLDVPGENAIVLADRAHLSRIVSNLVQNAAEAVHGRNHPEIQVAIKPNGQFVELAIGDNGPGIPADALEKLNNAIQYSTKPSGNGLGVSGSMALAKSMGGSLRMTSVMGVGTKAIVSIPTKPDAVAATAW